MKEVLKPLMLDETGKKIAEAIENFGAPSDKQADFSIGKWLDEHPEATTTVQDKSLTIDKMVVGTLGYVTPEMFGAKGDGVTDDTSAVQAAINYGAKVVLTKTYAVTGLKVAGESYALQGTTIEGNGNGKLILTDDNDGILVTGSGHRITGVQIEIAETVYNNGYDHAAVHIESTEALLSQNNTIDVIVKPEKLTYRDSSHNSKGIQITVEGAAYSYNNIITAKVWGLRYGVYCEETKQDTGKSLGINANTYNLNLWCCDCGFYGRIGGSIINGNCQGRYENFSFNIFENFLGTSNLINAYVYDLRYIGGGETRQYLIDEAQYPEDVSGVGDFGNNIFTPIYHSSSIKNYRARNKYTFTDGYDVPYAGFNTTFPKSQAHMALAPYSNCLKGVAESAYAEQIKEGFNAETFTPIAKVTQENVNAIVSMQAQSNYPTFVANQGSYSTGVLTDCSYLCGDNYVNRHIGLQRKDVNTAAKATIDITVPTDTVVQYVFVEVLNCGSIGCTLDGVELLCVEKNDDCAIFFNAGRKATANTTLTLTFDVKASETAYIKRISAIGYSWMNGTI